MLVYCTVELEDDIDDIPISRLSKSPVAAKPVPSAMDLELDDDETPSQRLLQSPANKQASFPPTTRNSFLVPHTPEEQYTTKLDEVRKLQLEDEVVSTRNGLSYLQDTRFQQFNV